MIKRKEPWGGFPHGSFLFVDFTGAARQQM